MNRDVRPRKFGVQLGHTMHQEDRPPALSHTVTWCVLRYYGEELDAHR